MVSQVRFGARKIFLPCRHELLNCNSLRLILTSCDETSNRIARILFRNHFWQVRTSSRPQCFVRVSFQATSAPLAAFVWKVQVQHNRVLPGSTTPSRALRATLTASTAPLDIGATAKVQVVSRAHVLRAITVPEKQPQIFRIEREWVRSHRLANRANPPLALRGSDCLECSDKGFFHSLQKWVLPPTHFKYFTLTGYYSPGGSSAPIPCPPGTYTDTEGQGSCKLCEAGKLCGFFVGVMLAKRNSRLLCFRSSGTQCSTAP